MLRSVIGSNSQLAIPPKEYGFFELSDTDDFSLCDQVGLLSQVLAWPKVRSWGLNHVEVRAFALGETDVRKAIYSAPLLAYASRMGKPGFGDKTPYLERHFKVLLKWFGSSTRFVHIIRDPFDTFLSMSYYQDFKECPTPLWFSNQWRASLVAGLHYSRGYPQQYLLLKYEDFVANPRHWTELICEFAGLPKELDRMLNMEDFSRKQNSSFPSADNHTQGLQWVVCPVETDRPSLSVAAAKIIRSEVFPYAGEAGYA